VHTAYASHDKVRKIFQLTGDPVPLERGLAQMAAWVRGHGPVEPSVFEGVEIRHKLPPTWLAALESSPRGSQFLA
jgi:UDP-glucose 4-epimerase